MSKGKILFQLSGSIACFKACQLLSRLVQSGYEVEVVATKSALSFIGEATLEGLTGRAVHTDTFVRGGYMQHIHLIRAADLVLLCPATANVLAKMASGIADDLLTTLFLAHDFKKPYLVAPAMNTQMLKHPATQSSIAKLRSWGVEILDSGSGALACGEVGEGRLLEPDLLFSEIETRVNELKQTNSSPTQKPDQLSLGTNLTPSEARSLRVLITSGGTREAIDGVRALTNTSSGRTGAEIAEYFQARGHEVTFLSAQNSVQPARPVSTSRSYVSFSDLKDALSEELRSNSFDAVIHAAAVSDYVLESVSTDGQVIPAEQARLGKIDSSDDLFIRLKRSPKLVDSLREVSSNPSIKVVAFKLTNFGAANSRPIEAGAASEEITQLHKEAVRKLAAHARPDFIVHNDLHDISPAAGKNTSGSHVATLYSGYDPEKIEAITQTRNKRLLAMRLEELLLRGDRP